jgi:hypothetical protein
MIDENSTLEDVCFAVAAVLDRFSIRGVLTGGSAATIYAPQVYASMDADFVLVDLVERERLREALASVGFVPSASAGMFEHARCRYTVDFPKGPLAVGGDYIHETATIQRGDVSLRILTPTDCVRDRLAHFYHWDDYTALNAAVGVARSQREHVDLSKLREWTEREVGPGAADRRSKFQEFLNRLAKTQS